MKKALIITFYWPPSGGAGVQRWLKMTKYFKAFDVQPIIYTAENPDMALQDFSLMEEVPDDIIVLKRPVWEPYDLYRKLLRKKKSEPVNQGFISETKRSTVLEKFAVWVRGNFFIPDARRFWIKPSVGFLQKYLHDHPVDVIISTGPPHSMHMIGLGLKNKTGIPWIADFRDPWTNIDFYDQLHLSRWADKKHHRLENAVLQNADIVVTVSNSWAEDFRKSGRNDVHVITNGYDEADFPNDEVSLTPGFVLHHIGSMNKDRNPHVLWKVLQQVCDENPSFKNDLKIKLTGKNDYSVLESISRCGLDAHLDLIDYIPHNQIVQMVRQSTILLLPLNDTPNVAGVIPGKLFEYLAAKRPIFCIGAPYGDTAKIIQDTKAGVVCDFTDAVAMKKAITELYVQYQKQALKVNSENILKYTRRGGAQQFAQLISQLTGC